MQQDIQGTGWREAARDEHGASTVEVIGIAAALAALLVALVLVLSTQGQQVGETMTGRIRAALNLSADATPGSASPGIAAAERADPAAAVQTPAAAPAQAQSSSWIDGLQLGLDFIGLIPVLGEPADLLNGLIYAGRGDTVNAGLSLIALWPAGGQAATAAKFGLRYGDEAVAAVRNTDNAADLARRTPCVGAVPAPTFRTLAAARPFGAGAALPVASAPLAAYNTLIAEARGSSGALAIVQSSPCLDAIYTWLRSRSPSNDIRRAVNEGPGPKVDPVYGYPVDRFEADHIVPLADIVNIPGFDKLTRQQQLEVANLRENFIGLGKSTNASKQDKSWSEWPGHSELGPVSPEVRARMLQLERDARAALERAVAARQP
ncbi:MAG: hypothetical protein H7Z42_05150 [Roseiflexaceae bacterium]|nr:hypothetical protein [Roseiflexaceae bacterium]